MQDIKELSLGELEHVLQEWDIPLFHARQIFTWIYKRGTEDFSAMSDLAASLRRRLKENFYLFELKLIRALKSSDGTKKLLLELEDKNLIEAVIISAEKRITGCISTQVGCKFKCRFCASALLGFKRNLTCAEMLGQVLYLRPTHLVFMGMGEPLDNYDNLIKAVKIINSSSGLNIGARRITISTCGIVPGIKHLAKEGLQIELSVSLHSADNKIRSKIMPINRIYPLGDLLSACREYIRRTNRQITFEYILMQGINSDLQSAQKLSKILRGLKIGKINLIPANIIEELNIAPPKKPEIVLFMDYLLKQGLNVTLRRPRGQDIEAACGQLRLRYEKK